MSLSDLIRGKSTRAAVAKANPAIFAIQPNEERAAVARAATVTAANPKEEKTPPPAPLTADQEAAVRAWLAHIGETDPAAIADVLERCQRDPRARAYTLGQEVPAPAPPRLVRCGDCAHYQRASYHPCLGHCAQGQPEPIAGLCDTAPRHCASFSRRLHVVGSREDLAHGRD